METKMIRRVRKQSRVSVREKSLQEDGEVEIFQPKLLRKPGTIEEVEEKKNIEGLLKSEAPAMSCGVNLINRNTLNPKALQKYLQSENSNFYVVGVVGMKDAGKTRLMNLLARQEVEHCKEHGAVHHGPLSGEFLGGNGVEAFITPNRLVLLDSAPILYNNSCQEFVPSEIHDHRQLMALFRLSHELLIVYERHQLFNVIRMLICAKNMMNPYEDGIAVTLVENRTQPGNGTSVVTETAKSLLDNSQMSDFIYVTHVPDFNCVSKYREEPLASIQQLREDILHRKELKAIGNPTETEKKWWDGLVKMNMEGGQVLKDFEALRDKFYQQCDKQFFS
jgi:hypothetical protein